MSAKKIAWEKWETEEVPPVEHTYRAGDDEDMMEELEEAQHMLFNKNIFNQFNMVSTPVGFFHGDDVNRPDRQFDCWVGHTNFELTHKIKSNIEHIEGVELLSNLSRYRFFIGIGKLFTFNGWDGIRFKIEKAITEGKSEEGEINEETLDIIAEIKNQIKTEKHWTIFVFPNGEYDYASSNIMDDGYLKKLSIFNMAKEFTGGIIVSSEEQNEHSKRRRV